MVGLLAGFSSGAASGSRAPTDAHVGAHIDPTGSMLTLTLLDIVLTPHLGGELGVGWAGVCGYVYVRACVLACGRACPCSPPSFPG